MYSIHNAKHPWFKPLALQNIYAIFGSVFVLQSFRKMVLGLFQSCLELELKWSVVTFFFVLFLFSNLGQLQFILYVKYKIPTLDSVLGANIFSFKFRSSLLQFYQTPLRPTLKQLNRLSPCLSLGPLLYHLCKSSPFFDQSSLLVYMCLKGK